MEDVISTIPPDAWPLIDVLFNIVTAVTAVWLACEREDKNTLKKAAQKGETVIGRIGRLVSFGMALFSVATMISGTVFQVSIMGRYWEQYSASERLMAVIQNHPIGVAVTVLVIVYNIFNFIMNYKAERS